MKSKDSTGEDNLPPFSQLPFMCEEFCSLIENRSEALQLRIDDLLEYLDQSFFERPRGSLDEFVDGLEHRLEEVWANVSGDQEYGDLRERYDQILATLWHRYDQMMADVEPPESNVSDEYYDFADRYDDYTEDEEETEECEECQW